MTDSITLTPAERFRAIGKALGCADPSCVCHEYVYKTTFQTHCPLKVNHNHGDVTPSFELRLSEANGTILLRCYSGNGCSPDALVAELRRRGLWWAAAPPTGLTVAQLAAAKGFTTEYLQTFGVYDDEDPHTGLPSVCIPYADQSGNVVAVHRRLALTGGQRFRWRSGDKPVLYGLPRLPAIYRQGYVVLCEGETDCWAAWKFDLPALGLPGKHTWKAEWAELLRRDGLRVYLWLEPDAGPDVVEKPAKDFPALRVFRP